MNVVVIHLEALVSDDLKPMNHTLGARERVEMWVGRQLLARRDILGLPVEQEGKSHIDELAEDGRVEKRFPHGCRAEDGPTTEQQKQNRGRRCDEGIDDSIRQASGGHCRRQGNKDVDLLVELGVDSQGGKGLCRALGEADVRQALLLRGV